MGWVADGGRQLIDLGGIAATEVRYRLELTDARRRTPDAGKAG
jgi:hypothetical protein